MNLARRIAALAVAPLLLIATTAATPSLRGSPQLPFDSLPAEGWNATGEVAPLSGLEDELGASGNLRALIGTPTSLAKRPAIQAYLSGLPLDQPGVHGLGVPAPGGDSLVVVFLESLDALNGSKLGSYRVGRWPTTGAAAGVSRYAPPAGFIPVIPENESTLVSKRFRLRDFLTHDQQGVWPKVLVLQPTLLDKLELIGNELERRGLPGTLRVMSGFRTPQYNEQGVGAKGGRASASRHIYGDAADVFVDADGDERMDDLNGDGKSNTRDARVLFAIAEQVEAQHPELVGGLSAYPANAVHGPFVHVDTRGVRARW